MVWMHWNLPTRHQHRLTELQTANVSELVGLEDGLASALQRIRVTNKVPGRALDLYVTKVSVGRQFLMSHIVSRSTSRKHQPVTYSCSLFSCSIHCRFSRNAEYLISSSADVK